MKKSFIPKSLRPDVPGQYYTPDDAAENPSVDRDFPQDNILQRILVDDIQLSELKDVKFRKSIIKACLSYQGENAEILEYKKIFLELYPETAKQIDSIA